MTANSSLCLQDFPLPSNEGHGKKIVSLTPVTSSGSTSDNSDNSPQDVAAALAAMTQGLLTAMQKMIQFLSTEAQQNATDNQLNTAASTQEANKAVQAMKDLQASEHSFWSIFLKYVLGPIIAVVCLALAAFTGGATAFLLAVVVLAITMIPVHNGQGMLASAVNAAVQGIGDACGWSQSTIDIVEGVVNLIVGIILGIVTGGAATEAAVAEVAESAAETVETTVSTVSTVLESATETVAADADTAVATIVTDVETVAEDSASTTETVAKNATTDAEKTMTTAEKEAAFKIRVGRMTGINAATSQITSSNAFQDIVYGSLVAAGVNDAESQEIASIVGLIMNLLCMIASMGYGLKSAGSIAESASEIKPASLLNTAKQLLGEESMITKLIQNISDESSTIGSMLSKLNPGTTLNVLRGTAAVAGLASAGATGMNGNAQRISANLAADLTRIKGQLALLQGNSAIIAEMTTMVNNALSSVLKKYDALEQAPNYFSPLFSEAKAMLQANQQA